MFKTITKLSFIVALATQFAAFAGGVNLNTTWNPSTLFVKATNGSVTTGTFTITSQMNQWSGSVSLENLNINYSNNTISPLALNISQYQHIGTAAGSQTTSIIGYTINLTNNTFTGTTTGFLNINNNSATFYGSMPFTIVTENTPALQLPPSIINIPDGDIILNGSVSDACNVAFRTFTASVSGSFLIRGSMMCPNVSNTYSWYYNNNTTFTGDDILIGALNSTVTSISLSAANLSVGGYYVKIGTCKTRSTCTPGPMGCMPFVTSENVTSISGIYNFLPNASITSQPLNNSVCVGSTTGLVVSVVGTLPTYIWSNGVTTPGISAGAGTYTVTVNGLCNTQVSQTATLTSLANTSIVSQPVSQSTCAGSNVLFAVSATGTNLMYAWSNGLSNTNTMSTNVANTNYNVTVSGSCGLPVVSNNVVLSNYFNLQYMTGPSTSQTICGEKLTALTVHPIGSGVTILWNTGATTAGINVSTAGVYMVTSSGFCGAPLIENIELTIDNVSPLTAIVKQPKSIVIPGLATGTISVSAVGTNLSYMWSTGENTPSISPTTTGFYSVNVMGKCNNITSDNVYVEVLNPSRTLPTATVSNNVGTLNLDGAVLGLCQATSRTFNLTVSGSFDSPSCAVATPRYRWFFDNNTSTTSDDIALTAFDGQKSISLTEANVTFGGYYAIVNTCRSMPGAPIPCVMNPTQMCPGTPTIFPSSLTTAVQTIDGTNFATIPLTTIVSPLINQDICVDNTVIEISATGANLQYVWSNTPGNNSNNNTVSTTTSISVTVQGDCGMPQTTIANYVRKEIPVLVTRPRNVDIFTGQTATITVSSAGTNLTYNWSSGETGTTISGKGAGTYFVTISGPNVCTPEVYSARVREIPIPTITGIFTTGNPATATVATVTGLGFIFSTNDEDGVVIIINNLWAGLKLNSGSTFVVVSLVGIAPKSSNIETIVLSSILGTEMYAYNDEDYPSPTVTITAIDVTIPTVLPSSATINGVTLSGNPANSITISGTGFVNGATVTVNGVVLTNIIVVNGNTIVATLPSGFNSSSVNVAVQNPNQVASTPTTVVNPINTSVPVASTTGVVLSGNPANSMTISGTGFVNGATVTVNGVVLTNITVVNGNTIVATLPSGFNSNSVNVAVQNPNQVAGTPTTVVNPINTSVPVASTTGVVLSGNPANSITISGTGFVNGATVTVNGVVLTNIILVNGNTIVATLPSGFNSNSVNVAVQNPNQVASTPTTVVNPINTSVPVASTTGVVLSGNPANSMTISGTGFANGATVTVNGVVLSNIIVVNGNTIVATLPSGFNSSSVNVAVQNPGQVGVPTLNIVSPPNTSVPVATVTGIVTIGNITTITGPTLITVNGLGFSSRANITINGVAVPVVASIGNNTLIINLPVGVITNTGAVNVQVSNPNQVPTASVLITPTDATMTSTNLPTYQSTSFSIYPNPSNGEFSVNIQQPTTNTELLTIFNALGSIVYTQKIDSENTQIKADLAKGIYLVKVGNRSKKLVVD